MSLRVLLSFLLVSFLSTSFWVYVYIRGIWLGDRRDVRLVSYQRDLGVLDVSWGEEGRVFVGHIVKDACCLGTLIKQTHLI